MMAAGNAPRSRLDLVFHFKDLERMGLVDATSGDTLIRPGDRLAAIRDLCDDLVQAVRTPPGLYVTEARPIGFGLNLKRPHRNLLLVAFEVFAHLDHYLWWTIKRWLKKKHKKRPMRRIYAHYGWRKPGGRTIRWQDGDVRPFELVTLRVEHFRHA